MSVCFCKMFTSFAFNSTIVKGYLKDWHYTETVETWTFIVEVDQYLQRQPYKCLS